MCMRALTHSFQNRSIPDYGGIKLKSIANFRILFGKRRSREIKKNIKISVFISSLSHIKFLKKNFEDILKFVFLNVIKFIDILINSLFFEHFCI